MDRSRFWNGVSYLRVGRSERENEIDASSEPSPKKILHEYYESIQIGVNQSCSMRFTKCFPQFSSNYEIYQEAITPMLYGCLKGVHGTVFSCKFEFPLLR
jgi:hypothetical protein